MDNKTYITNIYKHDQEIEIATLEGTQNFLYEIPKAYQKDIDYLISLIESKSLDTVFSGSSEDWEGKETLSLDEVKKDLKYYCK